MVQSRTSSVFIAPVLIFSAYLVWRGRRTTRTESDALNEDTPSVVLVDIGDDKLQLQILNQAIERGDNVLTNSTASILSFDAQVGGMSAHKKTFLRIKPVYVLKPLRHDHRKVREIGFYELVNYSLSSKTKLTDLPSQGWDIQMDHLQSLRKLIPKYYGIVKLDKNQVRSTSASPEEDAEYIILGDLTRNYAKPCIIDVKMGTQSFEPDAPAEKKRKEVEKYPQQADFGFRVVGMRVHDPPDAKADDNGYVHYSKHYGRSLSSKFKLKDSFRTFFGVQRTRRASISSVLVQLEEIKSWFLQNDSICFYSSSLMIVYEGDDEYEGPSPPTVKMIDFARVRRKKGGDDGYIVGLSTLITLLQEIELER